MSHTGYPGAPPGWYPDPAGGPGRRWWDGYAWTDATVLPQIPPPPPWAQAAPPAGAAPQPAGPSSRVRDELGLLPLARLAVVMPAVYYLVNLLVQRVNASQWRSIGHQFRVDWHEAQVGVTPPPYHVPAMTLTPLALLVGALAVAAVVVACMWQHRAATAARELGFPARRSPAWGVGCWFVPVVSLWMPYGAIRDCLPPGHPDRPRVLRWWIAWVGAAFLTALAGVCALFSSVIASVLSVPAALCCVAVVAWAPGIVTSIGAAHRDASASREQGAGERLLPG